MEPHLWREPGSRFAVNLLAGWDLARLKSESLPAAREYLKTSRKQTDQQLAAMSDDQIVALYLAEAYRALRDDFFKTSYLPAPEALSQFKAAEERIKTAKPGPLALFASIHPTLRALFVTDLRHDRRVAILRVIESLRLYAAAHDGALPESLNQITEVPSPTTRRPASRLNTASTATPPSFPPAGRAVNTRAVVPDHHAALNRIKDVVRGENAPPRPLTIVKRHRTILYK